MQFILSKPKNNKKFNLPHLTYDNNTENIKSNNSSYTEIQNFLFNQDPNQLISDNDIHKIINPEIINENNKDSYKNNTFSPNQSDKINKQINSQTMNKSDIQNQLLKKQQENLKQKRKNYFMNNNKTQNESTQIYKPNQKFFNEMSNNSHKDIQYGKKTNIQDTHSRLIALLSKFSTLCINNDIKPIIMHGTLIGWFFNKKILPWDDDIDICLIGKSIANFKKLNGYEDDDIIIKINPNSENRTIDKKNIIDARVISKEDGTFLDITFLYQSVDEYFSDQVLPLLYKAQTSTNPFLKANSELKLNHSIKSISKLENINEFKKALFVNCKSPHYYYIKNILPLKQDEFENIPVYIPNNITNCLVQEYGYKVLTPKYKYWIFSEQERIWKKKVF